MEREIFKKEIKMQVDPRESLGNGIPYVESIPKRTPQAKNAFEVVETLSENLKPSFTGGGRRNQELPPGQMYRIENRYNGIWDGKGPLLNLSDNPHTGVRGRWVFDGKGKFKFTRDFVLMEMYRNEHKRPLVLVDKELDIWDLGKGIVDRFLVQTVQVPVRKAS